MFSLRKIAFNSLSIPRNLSSAHLVKKFSSFLDFRLPDAHPTLYEGLIEETVTPVDKSGRIYGLGRRKTSSARVFIREGSGLFVVNHRPFAEYFQPMYKSNVLEAFGASKTSLMFDVECLVTGGGMSGQAGAIRLGLSRAIQTYDKIYRIPLKRAGLLTRDSRVVERKKPGQKKARKKYQWVKR